MNVKRQKDLTPKAKHFYKKYVDSGRKLAKLSNKLGSFKEKFTAAQKLASSKKFENLFNHVNTPTYNFILSQVRTQKQKPKARRFTIDEKILCLTLLKASGKGYKLLSKIFSLPSKNTLSTLLNKIPFRAGINKNMFNTLKISVDKMKKIDRFAILIFDEMAIDSTIHYSTKEDEFIGLHDLGNGNRKPQLADHVNVCMIKGIFRHWKQPLSYTLSCGPTKSIDIKKLITDIIRECAAIGLTILATVCDQGGPNQAAINYLLEETKSELTRRRSKKIFWVFS